MSEFQIAAVLVLYNEKYTSSKTYQSLLKETALPIMVYDNSPEPQNINESDIHYVSDQTNSGVSKAYNQAWKWAKEKKYSHLLLLDSDSEFPKGAVERYKEAVEAQPERVIMPAMISNQRKISPFYFKNGKTHYGDDINYGEVEVGSIVAINSGLIVPISLMDQTSGYNELLPLDWSDVFFMKALKKIGAKAVHIDLVVKHGLSEHLETSIDSIRFRFELQLKGVRQVAETKIEWFQMMFWMKLKSMKLSIKHRSFWFLKQYLKSLNG